MSLPGNKPVVLSIAGFDPSGGAGVIADIRTFSSLGCLATAAVTSLTFQNHHEVFGAEHLSRETVRGQVTPILRAYTVAASKTGMLPTSEIVREVARLVRETELPAPVVDPVMHSTSGFALVEPGALETLLEELLPLARLITPNIPEAERLTGLQITNEIQMRQASSAIRELGARAVLIKGGHLRRQDADDRGQEEAGEASSIREAIDVLDDEGSVTVFRGAWIDGGNVRGTGCMLSAAIAACLAQGMTLEDSVRKAKDFVRDEIASSAT